jgi:hypothetical protein
VTALPTVPPSSPPPPIPNPFPQPFDASLSANFTSSSCLAFFVNFTQNLNFRSCRSFSLLLANSQAFEEVGFCLHTPIHSPLGLFSSFFLPANDNL